MIKSMTGFGRATAEGDAVKVTVELRTVNNRHLDTHVSLSQEFAELELVIKKQVQAALKRGRVDATVPNRREAARSPDPTARRDSDADVSSRADKP